MIVSCWRPVLAEKLLGKAASQEPRPNILLPNGELSGYGDIRIQRGQRRVIQLLGSRVQAIELVRPAADDYNLAEPGFERCDQPLERVRIWNTIHRGLP